MIKFQKNSPPICGSLHPATKEGFIAMLQEANEALTAGYDFVGFERIEKQLAAVYRKSGPVQSEEREDRPVLLNDGIW